MWSSLWSMGCITSHGNIFPFFLLVIERSSCLAVYEAWQLDTFRVRLQGGLLFCFVFLICDVEAQFLLWMCTAWHLANLVHWRDLQVCTSMACCNPHFCQCLFCFVFFSLFCTSGLSAMWFKSAIFVLYLLVATSISGTEKMLSGWMWQ